MRAVLADAGPLYALVDRDDAHHERATTEASRLRNAGMTVIAIHPIVCETHALVLRRLGGSVARRWLAEITEGCDFINPSHEHYVAAAGKLGVLADQPITLFDGVLAQVAETLALPVWTYDHHFDLMEAAVWR